VIIGQTAGNAVVVVEDDGLGFDPEAVPQTPMAGGPTNGRRRLGLAGMRERVALVGGALEVESARGQGTTIIARIPLGGEADR
jgi:two-component system sensor histidine kinase UhpB